MLDHKPDHRDSVLVVDDDEFIRDFVRLTLTQVGIEVQMEMDAFHALTALESYVPDLILLDIMMPNMDGFTMCKKIKSNPALQNIPIIIITAYVEPDNLKKAQEVGAQGFLEKPISAEDLVKHVKNGLSGHFIMPKQVKTIKQPPAVQ